MTWKEDKHVLPVCTWSRHKYIFTPVVICAKVYKNYNFLMFNIFSHLIRNSILYNTIIIYQLYKGNIILVNYQVYSESNDLHKARHEYT